MPPKSDTPNTRSERQPSRSATARAAAAKANEDEDAKAKAAADAKAEADAAARKEQADRDDAEAADRQRAERAQAEADRAAAPPPGPAPADPVNAADPVPEPQVVTDGRALIAGLESLMGQVTPDVRRLFPELAEVFNAYQGQLPSIDERFKRVAARYARR